MSKSLLRKSLYVFIPLLMLLAALTLSGCGESDSSRSSHRSSNSSYLKNIPEDLGVVHPGRIEIEWSRAKNYIGKRTYFYGEVVDAEYLPSRKGSPTFLDIGAAYPDQNRLRIVIWGKNRKNFPNPPERTYKGKTIRVLGEVYESDGVCMIEVASPNQITFLDQQSGE